MRGERRVFRQGCFNSVPGLSATPACGASCVDNTTRLEDTRQAQLLFCCCSTNNCNQQFTWSGLSSPEVAEAGREEDLDINDKYLIVVGAVLGFDERDSIILIN